MVHQKIDPAGVSDGADVHCSEQSATYPKKPEKARSEPSPTWTFAMCGDYGPAAFLTNANGDRPSVMVRVGAGGLSIWIACAPWGLGYKRRDFAGASLASPTPHAYALSLITLLRDMALAKRDEIRSCQERRRG